MGSPFGEDPDRPSLCETQSGPINAGGGFDEGLPETVEPARPGGFRRHGDRLRPPQQRANSRNQEEIPVRQEANRLPAPEKHHEGWDEQRFSVLRVIDCENEWVRVERRGPAPYTPRMSHSDEPNNVRRSIRVDGRCAWRATRQKKWKADPVLAFRHAS